MFITSRKAITLLAVIALLLHALLPFYAVYQTPKNTDAKAMASIFSDKILLCTAEGFKLVSWKDLPNSKEEKHEPDAKYRCHICYVQANGLGIKSHEFTLTRSFFKVAERQPVFEFDVSSTLKEVLWRRFLTRSPPLSLVS